MVRMSQQAQLKCLKYSNKKNLSENSEADLGLSCGGEGLHRFFKKSLFIGFFFSSITLTFPCINLGTYFCIMYAFGKNCSLFFVRLHLNAVNYLN